MITNDQHLLHDHEVLMQNEIVPMEFIQNIFDEEGPFGEADCAGL
jgi:hypothetical protein